MSVSVPRTAVHRRVILTTLWAVLGSLAIARVSDAAPRLDWQQLPDLPDRYGVAGPFVGVHHDRLIVAGGANFPDGVPWHPTADGGKSVKRYYDTVYVLSRDAAQTYHWTTARVRLPRAIAYGVAVSTPAGVLCVGGEWQEHVTDPVTGELTSTMHRADDLFLVSCGEDPREVSVDATWHPPGASGGRPLPKLPIPTTAAAGALVGDAVYIAGGDTGEGGNHNFWRLDLVADPLAWEKLPAWDGPPRTHAIAVEQGGKFYLFSGRSNLEGRGFELYTDAHCFDPAASDSAPDGRWTRLAEIVPAGGEPTCAMAGTGAKLGANTILLFGGARGDVLLRREKELPAQIERARAAGQAVRVKELQQQANALYDNHAGFSREILAYQVDANAWTLGGQMPATSPVTTSAVRWGDSIVIPSGEKAPGIRTRDVWLATPDNRP